MKTFWPGICTVLPHSSDGLNNAIPLLPARVYAPEASA